MSLLLARQTYRRAEQAEPQVPDDPHAVIGVALGELLAALERLSLAAAAGRSLPTDPMTRAMAALYLLQGSLDFERGGDIAPALFQVYEHCRLTLVDAFRNDPDAAVRLQQAHGFIATLREAWGQMPRA